MMSMSMGFRQVQHQSQRQELSQRQLQQQRQEQRMEQQLGLQQQLRQVLRLTDFQPKGDCPGCGQIMTPVEILRGFSSDPKDYTTTCPQCEIRFTPKLEWRSDLGSTRSYAFYCSAQTLDQLPGKEALRPQQLQTQHGSLYQSAIFHFGSLRAAFQKVDLHYQYRELEVQEWQRKIKPFLGKISDRQIAGHVEVSASTIRRLRQHFNIPAYQP